jgi:hypothetical protein
VQVVSVPDAMSAALAASMSDWLAVVLPVPGADEPLEEAPLEEAPLEEAAEDGAAVVVAPLPLLEPPPQAESTRTPARPAARATERTARAGRGWDLTTVTALPRKRRVIEQGWAADRDGGPGPATASGHAATWGVTTA